MPGHGREVSWQLAVVEFSENQEAPLSKCASLVDSYRAHLRKRRTEDPAVPVSPPLRRDQGPRVHRCLNPLHKYIN